MENEREVTAPRQPRAELNAKAEQDFGRNVQRLRKFRGWSQEDLAARMAAHGYPMHQVTVGKIENANRPTSVGEVAALALIFGVEPRDLLQLTPADRDMAAVDEALRALQAKKAELKAVNEQIAELMARRGQLKRERGQLIQAYHVARKRAGMFPSNNKDVIADEDAGDG